MIHKIHIGNEPQNFKFFFLSHRSDIITRMLMKGVFFQLFLFPAHSKKTRRGASPCQPTIKYSRYSLIKEKTSS